MTTAGGLHRTPLNRFFLKLLAVLLIVAAITASAFAVLSFWVAGIRDLDSIGAQLFIAGLAYVVLAQLWAAAAWGVFHLRRWGWFVGLVASLAAVLNGLYRLLQSPTLGPVGAYDLGLWSTTIVATVTVAYALSVFRLFFRRRELTRPTMSGGPP